MNLYEVVDGLNTFARVPARRVKKASRLGLPLKKIRLKAQTFLTADNSIEVSI